MGYGMREEKSFFNIDKETGKFSKYNKDKNSMLYDYIDGEFVSLNDKTTTLDDGTPVHKLILNLRDNKELIEIGFGFTSSPARTLINSLLTLDAPIGYLKLTAYKKKDSKYTNLYIERNNQKVDWKFKPEDVPAIETEVLKSGKEVLDSTIRDKFWTELYFELRNRINIRTSVSSDEQAYSEFSGMDNVNQTTDDDIPF